MKNKEKATRCPIECVGRKLTVATPERRGIVPGNRGFTFIELLVVCFLLGILVTLAIPTYNQAVDTAKASRSAEEIRSLEKTINAYQADLGVLPNLNQLIQAAKGNINDPWGHPYEYHIISGGYAPYEGHFGSTLNTDYDLYSLGPNADTANSVAAPLDPRSSDDIVRAGNGAFVGKANAFDEF